MEMARSTREFQVTVVPYLESAVLTGAIMHKFFGVIFLSASFAVGFLTWRIWRDMGEHSTSMVLLPGGAIVCFFLLVVGVKFMLGQNPVKEMWLRSSDDD
jgi:hypothetical protein